MFVLPFKGVMLDVSKVSNETIRNFGPRLAALICSLKHSRNPQSNRKIFSHVVDRINVEQPKDEAVDLLRQMNY